MLPREARESIAWSAFPEAILENGIVAGREGEIAIGRKITAESQIIEQARFVRVGDRFRGFRGCIEQYRRSRCRNGNLGGRLHKCTPILDLRRNL